MSDIAIGGFVNDEEFRAALRGRDPKDLAAEHPVDRAERIRLHLDQLLDQALDASFPASDSPSIGNST
jgi:hypothetical protein